MHFTSNQIISNIKCNLIITNTEVILNLSSSLKNVGYIHYTVLDNVTDTLIKKSKIDFENIDESKMHNTNKDFIPLVPFNVKGFENKSIDTNGIIANELYPDFSKYIALNTSKSRTFYKTFIGKKGVWLLESDNTSYYKLLFFKK